MNTKTLEEITDSESILDESKERLAKIFERIESIIEKKLNTKSVGGKEVQDLKKEIDSLHEKNIKLSEKLEDLNNSYTNLQIIHELVIKDLDQLINSLQTTLENQNGNS